MLSLAVFRDAFMLEIVITLLLALVLGLVAYERFGMRLGGVLVLPLLTAYTLFEPRLVPVFVGAAAIAYFAGKLVQRNTLVYGRRLLYTYIGLGLLASSALIYLTGIGVAGIALAVLPGIFAFNVHREGKPMRSVGQFAFLYVPTVLLAHVALLPLGFRGGLFEYAGWARAAADSLGGWAAMASPIGSAFATPGLLDSACALPLLDLPEGCDAE
jgi:hypothetical protein